MTTVYLVRHAEAEGNTYRRIHGQYNSLITENGDKQIEALRARFETIPIDACLSSDLFRTCRTAQSVYLAKKLPLFPDSRFRETNVGRWEDTPFGWLERYEKRDMDRFNHEERIWHVAGSETWEDYTSRFLQGLDEQASRFDGKTIAIFTHACVLRGVQKRILKTDDLPFCENTAVSRLCWNDGEITFEFLNDASHLAPEISTAQRQKRLKQGATDRADFSLWFRQTEAALETYAAMLRGKTVGELVLGKTEREDVGVIESLCLDEGFRGRRFGQQLLGQAVCTLRKCGAKKLFVTVPEKNADAQHFFRENGFTFAENTETGVLLQKDIEVWHLP